MKEKSNASALAWIMIVCARGARRNRVWGEMQPHLHRGTFARGAGFAKSQ